MRPPAPQLALLLALALVGAAACSNGAPQQVADGEAVGASGAGAEGGAGQAASAEGGAGGAEGSGVSAEHGGDGAGAGSAGSAGDSEAAAANGAGGPRAADGSADPGAASDPSGAGAGAGAAAETPPPPAPDIFTTMVGAGFERVHEEDLADYLPVPPRSEGQVGQFRAAGGLVRVARVTYPAAAFADPHERWLRERIAVLTTRFERVLRVGPTVVHIDADSAALADRAEAAFAPLMPGYDAHERAAGAPEATE